MADLAGYGRQLAAACVRTLPPTPGRVQFPQLALDVPGHRWSPDSLAMFKRLGIKGARTEIGYVDETTSNGFYRPLARSAEMIAAMWHNDVTLLVTVSGARAAADGPVPAPPERRQHDQARQVRHGLAALGPTKTSRSGAASTPARSAGRAARSTRWSSGTSRGRDCRFPAGRRHPALPRPLHAHGAGRRRGPETRPRPGAHRRVLLVDEHRRQALLRRERHVPEVARFREHPLPADVRDAGVDSRVDDPQASQRPGAGVGHRELGGQLGRSRGGRGGVDAGPGPDALRRRAARRGLPDPGLYACRPSAARSASGDLQVYSIAAAVAAAGEVHWGADLPARSCSRTACPGCSSSTACRRLAERLAEARRGAAAGRCAAAAGRRRRHDRRRRRPVGRLRARAAAVPLGARPDGRGENGSGPPEDRRRCRRMPRPRRSGNWRPR